MRRVLCVLTLGLVGVMLAGFASMAMAQETTPGGAAPKQPIAHSGVLSPFPGGSLITMTSMQAADALQASMPSRVSKESPILVASMVSLDDFAQTSSFGRLVMQQVGSRLSQYGYRVVDSRLGRDMIMKSREGEFMLTRDTARLLQAQYNAQAVLVGNYTLTKTALFCSVRLLRLDDGAVIAAYEYHLPNKGEVKKLLRQETAGIDSIWAYYVNRQPAFAGTTSGQTLPPVRQQLTVPRPVQQAPARDFGALGPPERLLH